MPLPNFIIFGAIKSGTGALHQYLSLHPDVFMSSLKEPRYFFFDENHPDRQKRSNKSFPVRTMQEYLDIFKDASGYKAIGESSSNYMYSSKAARRIKSAIPDVKLIASIRNPVDRAYAHYCMSNRVVDEIAFKTDRGQGWLTSSLYFDHLTDYYSIFDKSQIKIILFEEWTRNTRRALIDIYEFLNIDTHYQLPSYIQYTAGSATWPRLNSSSMIRRLKPLFSPRLLMLLNRIKSSTTTKPPKLSSETRREMVSWYQEDILKLQDLLGRDLSIWTT